MGDVSPMINFTTMHKLKLFVLAALAVSAVSCAEMLGTQRVNVDIPERQNWKGVTLHGDIAKIEALSYELEGRLGLEYKGELLNQTTTEFNLRGDVESIVSVDDMLYAGESSIFEYDEKGRLVSASNSYAGALFEHRYTLDDYGCVVVDELYLENGLLDSRKIVEYDRKGNDVEYRSVDSFGNVNYVQNRTFDDKNHLIEVVIADGDDQVRSREVYTYDAEGRKIGVAAYEGYDMLKSREEFIYGQAGESVEHKRFSDLDELQSRTIERYDSEGRLVEVASYLTLDTPESTKRIVYDESGCKSEERTTNSAGVDTLVVTYKYDANGNVVETREQNNAEKSLLVTLYSYDEKQNLKEEREYSGAMLESQSVTEYVITYRE